ncbi:MAG: hypothetical protein HY695_05260 [Deltaproteobacteria bacterium]|nr:hypothetical protein [Deltaproteobacteria bacterium]
MASENGSSEAVELFSSGLRIARWFKFPTQTVLTESPWARAAFFPRRKGSGQAGATDSRTGSWLLAAGSWFHADGYGSGAEARLLQRYLEIGPDRLGLELEGFFVIVIGDAGAREAVVITDVVGSCHAFVRSLKHGMALSNSSLLLAGLGEVSPDPVGCQEFISAGVIYEDRSLYREVRKLGPASVYRFVRGALREMKRYWQITDLTPESMDGKAAVSALGDRLILASQKIKRIFPNPVCDLTGGYDSRAIVGAFLSAGLDFSTTVAGPDESPDVLVSRELVRRMKLRHLHVRPPDEISFEQVKKALALTDGECDLVEYARVLGIHEKLSAGFDVSINGSFGEVARGYWWELLLPYTGARREIDARKLARRRYAPQAFDASLFPPENRLDLITHFAEIIERTNHGLSGFPNTLQMDHSYLMMRMQRWQGRIASSTDRLWPCLSPFQFRSVLETMLQTTAQLRRRSLLIRSLLAESQPELASVPLEHGYPPLPVSWKSFHRFWPVPVRYGRKMISKVFSPERGNTKAPSAFDHDTPKRLQLWRDEEVRELLCPSTMEAGEVLDRRALGDFLDRSRQRDFPFDAQWNRVLSVEYTLRSLAGLSPNGKESIQDRGADDRRP